MLPDWASLLIFVIIMLAVIGVVFWVMYPDWKDAFRRNNK